MAGCPSRDGIKLNVWDEAGNLLSSTFYPSCEMTAQTTMIKGQPSSVIADVFLAQDEVGLYGLKCKYGIKRKNFEILATSGGGSNLIVSLVEEDGSKGNKGWMSGVATGEWRGVDVGDPGKPQMQPVQVYHVLDVTDADLTDPANSTHPLYVKFQDGQQEAAELARTSEFYRQMFA